MSLFWFLYAMIVTELLYVALALAIVLVAFLWLLRRYIRHVKCSTGIRLVVWASALALIYGIGGCASAQTRLLLTATRYAQFLLLVCVLAGCATTSAKISAQGAHIISPYGVVSFGAIDYQREADPEAPAPKPAGPMEDFLCTASPSGQTLVLHCGSYPSWERYIKEQRDKGAL